MNGNSVDFLYKLSGKHLDDGWASEPDEDWEEREVAQRFVELPTKLFCGSCGCVLSQARPINVLVNKQVNPRPLGGWGGYVCLGYVLEEFLHELDFEFFREHFHLGRIGSVRDGSQKGVVTFVGKSPPLFVRGIPESDAGICSLCTRRKYYAMPPKHRYVARGALTGAPIYWSDDGQLIVTPETLNRVNRKKWRKLGVTKLPVLDKPLDGLPDVFWP